MWLFHVSIDRRMDKQTMAQPHNECCSAWKEGDSDTGCSVEEWWAHYAQGRKPDTKELVMSESTHTRPRAVGTIDTESRTVCARGWGRGMRTERLMGTVLVLQERSSSGDSSHDCIPVWWTLKCALQQALRWQMLCVCNHKFLKLKNRKKSMNAIRCTTFLIAERLKP